MKFYLIVTGRGRDRRILTYCKIRKTAIQILNRAILDCDYPDARLVVSKIQPPVHLYHKGLESK